MIIEFKVPGIVAALRDQVSTPAGLNGDFAQFCELLLKHCSSLSVELPSPSLSSREVAEALEDMVRDSLPNQQTLDIFDAQIEVLKQANVPRILFDPLPAGM